MMSEERDFRVLPGQHVRLLLDLALRNTRGGAIREGLVRLEHKEDDLEDEDREVILLGSHLCIRGRS
jgi:hypothetical protein